MMTADQIKSVVLRILGQIAPEANLQAIEPDVSFREQLDIDSFDFLNFVIAIHEELGIDIPEVDYPKLGSLDGCVAYLLEASGKSSKAGEGATSGAEKT